MAIHCTALIQCILSQELAIMAIKLDGLLCIRSCILLLDCLQVAHPHQDTQQKRMCIYPKEVIRWNYQDGGMKEWETGRLDGTVTKYGIMGSVWLRRAFTFIELIRQ